MSTTPNPPASRAPRTAKANASPTPGLEDRIHACYEGLPGSEARVADVLLNHPGLLATHSATELAADAGVSKAAVTRLIQRLGYVSHAAARSQARLAQQWGSPLYLQPEAQMGEGRRAAYAKHVAADQQSLAHTLSALDETALDGSVLALARARRVVVLGFRNSAWLALYARLQIGLLRPAVDLAPLPAQTLAESLVGLGREDVLLAVGMRRRVPSFGAAIQAARSEGVRVVYLTDPTGAADVPGADWTLSCHCRGAAMFDTYVAAVSVINFLAAQVAGELGKAALQRLQGAETWHSRLGDMV
ncbi:MAG: MurR/RpiR family transcriptional regulator [Rubrivivax sp.]|nr:MurR/RpiR family transcriptional regulator [Rubrivivax sp.]